MGLVGVFVHQMLQVYALTMTSATNTGWLIGHADVVGAPSAIVLHARVCVELYHRVAAAHAASPARVSAGPGFRASRSARRCIRARIRRDCHSYISEGLMNLHLRTVVKGSSMLALGVAIGIGVAPQLERLFPMLNRVNHLPLRAATAQVTYGGYSGGGYSGQTPGSVTAVLPSGTGTPSLPDDYGSLSDADKEAISRAIEQYGSRAIDDSIREYVDRAREELEKQKVPGFKIDDVTAHRIEGPEIPVGTVTPFVNLVTPSLAASTPLPKTWQANRMRAWVVFRDADPSATSEGTHGNGVLIDSETVLTARHIAQYIQSKGKNRVSALALSTKPEEFATPLQIEGVVYFNEAVDPDLAVIKIKPLLDGASRWYPTLGKATPGSKGAIYSLGAMQTEELPRLTSGIVTTSVKGRVIHKGGTVPLTSFGTSLRTFPSISGSPIFDATSGNLIGIVVAGEKEYAKTGETRITVKGGSPTWENENRWTWAAPVPNFASSIQKATKVSFSKVGS